MFIMVVLLFTFLLNIDLFLTQFFGNITLILVVSTTILFFAVLISAAALSE